MESKHPKADYYLKIASKLGTLGMLAGGGAAIEQGFENIHAGLSPFPHLDQPRSSHPADTGTSDHNIPDGSERHGYLGDANPPSATVTPDATHPSPGSTPEPTPVPSGTTPAPPHDHTPSGGSPEPGHPLPSDATHQPQPDTTAHPTHDVGPSTPPEKLPPIEDAHTNVGTISGSAQDGTLTIQSGGEPLRWEIVDNGVKNITSLGNQLNQQGVVINQEILASKLQLATDLFSSGELNPEQHPNLWRLFHYCNGTASVFDQLKNAETWKSLMALGIIP